MFLGLDTQGQGLWAVVLKHWNSRLGDDGAGIHIRLDQMCSATTDPHRRLKSLTNRIEAFEAGQK